MFLKQTNSSLNKEHASMSDTAKGAQGTPAAPADTSTADRRRSSGAQQRYQNLMAQKRDPADSARRASITEQKVSGGMLSQAWHNFTKG